MTSQAQKAAIRPGEPGFANTLASYDLSSSKEHVPEYIIWDFTRRMDRAASSLGVANPLRLKLTERGFVLLIGSAEVDLGVSPDVAHDAPSLRDAVWRAVALARGDERVPAALREDFIRLHDETYGGLRFLLESVTSFFTPLDIQGGMTEKKR